MPTDVIMPKLGLTMEEGTAVTWRLAPGDRVAEGQILLDIETDKVVVEVEAPASGVLGPLLVGDGQKAPVGGILARIYGPGEQVAGDSVAAPRITLLAPGMAEQAGVDLDAVSVSSATGRVTAADVQAALGKTAQGEGLGPAPRPPTLVEPRATRSPTAPQNWGDRGARHFSSPRARKRAKELGLDWRTLTGSGPRGRVIERDVLVAAARPPSVPVARPPTLPVTRPPSVPPARGEEVRWETPSPVQRVVAERMAASFGSAPHFYLSAEVRADVLLAVHDRLLPIVERRAGVRLTLTDLLVRIVAAALAEHPRANAFWHDGRVGVHARVNVGIAVTTEAGLVVPVLRDADRKPLAQIAAERSELVEKARTGRLIPDDLAGGTFTLTNLGMYRVDSFQAILNPPQSAILAVGRIVERPAVIDGGLAVRPACVLTLSCDHRVLDGVSGAQFLGRVAELIEEPYGLLV